jgi:hypothetical protein
VELQEQVATGDSPIRGCQTMRPDSACPAPPVSPFTDRIPMRDHRHDMHVAPGIFTFPRPHSASRGACAATSRLRWIKLAVHAPPHHGMYALS